MYRNTRTETKRVNNRLHRNNMSKARGNTMVIPMFTGARGQDPQGAVIINAGSTRRIFKQTPPVLNGENAVCQNS